MSSAVGFSFSSLLTREQESTKIEPVPAFVFKGLQAAQGQFTLDQIVLEKYFWCFFAPFLDIVSLITLKQVNIQYSACPDPNVGKTHFQHLVHHGFTPWSFNTWVANPVGVDFQYCVLAFRALRFNLHFAFGRHLHELANAVDPEPIVKLRILYRQQPETFNLCLQEGKEIHRRFARHVRFRVKRFFGFPCDISDKALKHVAQQQLQHHVHTDENARIREAIMFFVHHLATSSFSKAVQESKEMPLLSTMNFSPWDSVRRLHHIFTHRSVCTKVRKEVIRKFYRWELAETLKTFPAPFRALTENPVQMDAFIPSGSTLMAGLSAGGDVSFPPLNCYYPPILLTSAFKKQFLQLLHRHFQCKQDISTIMRDECITLSTHRALAIRPWLELQVEPALMGVIATSQMYCSLIRQLQSSQYQQQRKKDRRRQYHPNSKQSKKKRRAIGTEEKFNCAKSRKKLKTK